MSIKWVSAHIFIIYLFWACYFLKAESLSDFSTIFWIQTCTSYFPYALLTVFSSFDTYYFHPHVCGRQFLGKWWDASDLPTLLSNPSSWFLTPHFLFLLYCSLIWVTEMYGLISKHMGTFILFFILLLSLFWFSTWQVLKTYS